MKKFLLIVGFIMSWSGLSYGQSTCPNSDFTMNNFTNWVGKTGTCCPISLPTTGIVNGRHTIMTGAGMDPNTANQVPVVCPGYTFSARLGNSSTSRQAESLSYQIFVQPDSSNALFFYNYAVVLQDPSHTPADQPRFELQVRDQYNNIIPCTEYIVTAGQNIPGFQSNGSIRYKNWESVGVDLSPFIGQNVTIELRTGDCDLGAHYGYAYVVAECRPMKLSVSYCFGSNTAVLTAPPGFASYIWSDGTVGPTTSVLNPTPGQLLTCTLISVSGCNAQLVAELNQTVITPDFADTVVCHNASFMDSSTVIFGINDQWDWDFGDGNTGTGQFPTHVYATGGFYDVELVVTSDNGCKDSIMKTIEVVDVPTASFTAPQVCGNEWDFINTSIGNDSIISVEWRFGDNTTDTTFNGNYTYPDPNISGVWTYDVELLVTNENNCSDSMTVPIVLHDIPKADYNYTAIICEGSLASFTDSSFVGNENLASWEWDFGDGNNSTQEDPTHIYTTNGLYPVELIVTSDNGCKDTISYTIDVGKVPLADFPLPDACGVLIQYADSSEDYGQPITDWHWDFGDGSTSTDQHPSHLFPANGQYTVELIVTNSSSCADTVSKVVTAYDKPVADFSFDSACPFQEIDMFDQSSAIYDVISDWEWTLAPGVTVNTQNTSYIYDTAGYIPVTLSVGTAFGCRDTITKNIYVYEFPNSDFALDPVCHGFISSFQNLSTIDTGSINSYSYDMSQAGLGVSNSPAPNVTFPNWGQFPVTLTTVSNYGCIDSITKTIRVYANPEASFTIAPVNGCSPLTSQFTNTSTIPEGQIVDNYWDLEMGSSNDLHTSFTYGTGLYTISLLVTSNFGCKDSITQIDAIEVYPDPVAMLSSNPKSNSVIEPSFQFLNESTGYSNSVWQFGDGTMSYENNPFHIYPNDYVGHYDVGLLVTNEYGCVDTTSGRVYVYDDHVIYLPNTITMNEDNINEIFTIYGTNIVEAELLVFSRWGEKVAHVKGWQLDKLVWNGLGTNGNLLKQDTYSYKLIYSTKSGKVFDKLGHINVIR